MRKKDNIVCNRCNRCNGLMVGETEKTITSILLHVFRCLNCGNIVEPGLKTVEREKGKHVDARLVKVVA